MEKTGNPKVILKTRLIQIQTGALHQCEDTYISAEQKIQSENMNYNYKKGFRV